MHLISFNLLWVLSVLPDSCSHNYLTLPYGSQDLMKGHMTCRTRSHRAPNFRTDSIIVWNWVAEVLPMGVQARLEGGDWGRAYNICWQRIPVVHQPDREDGPPHPAGRSGLQYLERVTSCGTILDQSKEILGIYVDATVEQLVHVYHVATFPPVVQRGQLQPSQPLFIGQVTYAV